MKLSDIKKLSLKKKGAAPPDEVYIESTTAEQIAEMKKRLAERTKDLEVARSQLKGLKKEGAPAGGAERVGPHPPLQELTLDDLKLTDDEDDELNFDTPVGGGSPVKVVSVGSEEEPEPAAPPTAKDEGLQLEDVVTADAAGKDSLDLGGSDDIKNLFSQDEEEDHPLANLINFLPDVSVQELQDDIEEIKSIIKEWQQSR